MLKNVLSLLLSKFYSKKESELVGHQAMPSSQSISITPTVNSVGDEVATVATFNAQADGFVIVRATTDGAPPSRLILSSYVSTYIFNNSAGGTIATFIPIAKGIQCTVQGRNLKNIVISLYKTIGGVQTFKDALLQGGGLCLSHWYSSLRRSSLLAKRNGSEVKVFSQTRIPEQRSLLTTLRLSFIRLQVMDGLRSAETDHRSMSALPESWERVALTLKVISELQLRFGRGIPLVSIARRTISNRLRQNSFPAKGQRNTSLVGGASC